MHPSEVLFEGENKPVLLPVCDHYAGSEKLMRKSLSLQHELGPIFDITFDCEDGAAAGNETAHAQLVASLLNSEENRFGRIGVRVHDADNDYFEKDVAILCRAAARRLAYLVVPKVRGAAQVSQALQVINRHARENGRINLPVHVLIETHQALAEVRAIAALPQVECLSFGIMDFVSAHYGAIPASAMSSPGQFTHPLVIRAKLEISAACHAHGKIASHNVTTDIRDMSVVKDDAMRARNELGFTRMWSIHPGQIQPIVQAMSPTHQEVEEAAQILQAAVKMNWGPIQHDGKLHDRASYRYYWTVLQRARSGGLSLPDHALSLL